MTSRLDLDIIGQIATTVPLPTPAPGESPGRHVPGALVLPPLPSQSPVDARPRSRPVRPSRTAALTAADPVVLAALGQPEQPATSQRRDRLGPEGEADVAAFRAALLVEGRVQPATAATWSYTLRQVLRGDEVDGSDGSDGADGADGADGPSAGYTLATLPRERLWAWWLRPELSTASRAHYRCLWAAVQRWRPDVPELPAPVTAAGLGEDIYLALERAGAAASLSPERLIASTWGRPLARVVGAATVGALALGLHGRELGGGAWLTGRPVVPRWIGSPEAPVETTRQELARWIEAGAGGREELRRRPARPPRRRWGAGDGA